VKNEIVVVGSTISCFIDKDYLPQVHLYHLLLEFST